MYDDDIRLFCEKVHNDYIDPQDNLIIEIYGCHHHHHLDFRISFNR